MAYSAKYTIPFQSVEGVNYVVTILEDGFAGESTELKGATPAMTIRTSGGDELFTPHRHTSATLNLLVRGYLTDLFSTSLLDHKVMVTRNGTLYWSGYIKPESYTQDYQHDLFSWSVECQSELSVLWHMQYQYAGTDPAYVSLTNVLRRAIAAAGGDYTYFYYPVIFKAADGSNLSAISSMTISEYAFKDMTWGDVLDAICNLFGWTITDKNGSVYLVDPDCTNDGISYYRLNASTFGSATSVSSTSKSIQSIGHRNTNDTLDIIAGFNKASVSCDLISLEDDGIDDLDYDKLTLKSNSDVVGEAKQVGHNGDYHRTYKRFYLPSQYDFYVYDTSGNRVTDEAVIDAKDNEKILGAVPIMAQDLVSDNAGSYFEPIRYTDKTFSLDECIQVRLKYGTKSLSSASSKKMLSIKAPIMHYESGSAVSADIIGGYEYDAGAIVISGDVIVNYTDAMPLDEEAEFTSYSGEYKEKQRYIKASLRIGNLYYGEDFSSKTSLLTWRENPDESLKYFRLWLDGGKLGVPASILNNKEMLWHYDESNGYFCRLVNNATIDKVSMTGDVEFSLYGSAVEPSIASLTRTQYGYIIKNLQVKYVKCSRMYDYTPDKRIYQNVVNSSYINDAAEHTTKICTWNEDDGACYNHLLYNGSYLTDQLTNRFTNTKIRLEELYLTRLVNHYKQPLVKLSLGAKLDTSVTPLKPITDDNMSGRKFLVTSSERDLQYDRERLYLVQCSY